MRPPNLATTAAAVLVVFALAGSVLLLVGTTPARWPVPSLAAAGDAPAPTRLLAPGTNAHSG